MHSFEFDLACRNPSFLVQFRHCVLSSKFGCSPLFVAWLIVFVKSSVSGKEGVHHLLNESWPRLEGVVSASVLVRAFLFVC